MRFDSEKIYDQLNTIVDQPLLFEGEVTLNKFPYPDIQLRKLDYGDEWTTWQMGSYIADTSGMIPNPMFIIRLFEYGTAEALQYSTAWQNYVVYTNYNGVNYVDAKSEQMANGQLKKWLDLLVLQGYKHEIKPPKDDNITLYPIDVSLGVTGYHPLLAKVVNGGGGENQ